LLTRLKQLCDHPALLEDPPNWDESRAGKLHRLFEIFEELPSDEGILIFSQFSSYGAQPAVHLDPPFGRRGTGLRRRHPAPNARSDGLAFSERARPASVRHLPEVGKGVGLNLTRASTVIHYDRWWNPAVENSGHRPRLPASARSAHVQVFKLSTQGTLEEQIDRILTEKQSLVTGLIEDGDSWLADLDDNELARLLLPGGAI
jgi:SNF2 family DNA or RNA helicase